MNFSSAPTPTRRVSMFKFVSIALALVFVSAASAQEAWKPPSYCAAAAPVLKSMVNKSGDYNIDDNTHQREYAGLFEKATLNCRWNNSGPCIFP